MAAPTSPPNITVASSAPAVPATRSGRLVALDAWRGVTILLMLLVNNAMLGSATPAQLQHAPWGGGVHLADLVFPWFLFCAGTALPFSLAAARGAGLTGARLVGKLLSRAALLFLVGCFLVSVVQHSLFLGLGVLQLIALASLLGGLTGALPLWWRLALALGLLLGYDTLIRFVPLPDGSVGVFQEGRSILHHLNETILEPLGLRGLLSVIPTGALVLLGSVAGELTRCADAARRLLVFGALLTVLGVAWAAVLEFNKPFWTPSYIVFSAGLGVLGLLACFLVGDRARRGVWLTPFVWAGRNALFAYVAPILFKTWILQDWQVNWIGKPASLQDSLLAFSRAQFGAVGGGWLYTLGYIALCWLALGWLARRKMYWKL